MRNYDSMKHIRYIKPAKAEVVIHGLKQTGKSFSVLFSKADGSLRTMNCRGGVTSHLQGGKTCYNPDKNIGVFDMNKKAYRSIPKDRILAIKQGKTEVTA